MVGRLALVWAFAFLWRALPAVARHLWILNHRWAGIGLGFRISLACAPGGSAPPLDCRGHR